MVKVLSKDGHQRVLLTGKAGIGKTRLAKKVGEHANNMGFCFLTICLHLNKKIKDEQSLYEYIASQLSVYSDFEETEVDDRDEDEEDKKEPDVLLNELKRKIVEEIATRKDAVEKARKDAAEKAMEKAAEKGKKLSEKNVKKPQLGDGKNEPAAGKLKPENTEDVGKKTHLLSTEYPYILLILDDEGKKTSEDAVMKDLKLWKFLKEEILTDDTRLKILVTRRRKDEEPTKAGGTPSEEGDKEQEKAASESEDDSKSQQGEANSDNNSIVSDGESQGEDNKGTTEATGNLEITDGETVPPTGAEPKLASKFYDEHEIEFPTTDESEALHNSINKGNMIDLFVSLIPRDWKTEKELISNIVEKSKNLPAAIVVLAKSLKWITTTFDSEKKEIKEKIDEVLSADRSDSSDSGSSSESAVNPILYLAYVLLKTYDSSKGAILDCFWHSLDFFEQCGCVYYRDLITQWMLEGYFDPVRSVEKAYQAGHSILMDLINRGMLKIQENNVVVPEMAMISLIDPRPRGHFGRSRLGFSRVYGGDKEKGIGKVTQIDDMIKTVQAKKGDKITTILVSGDRLRRETPGKFFKELKKLEVLGLFEPTVEPFIPTFSDQLTFLRVLVIRDCDLLKSIEELKTLTKLNALEVSGASSLDVISDDFFKAFLELQSLHLSGLQITSSPSSISHLKKLHCLIIKDCPLLEDLPNIQELVDLEVVDISGARGLQTCFDNTKGDKKNKSKNKNFYLLTKLQLLDFSESQIERLPIFQDSAVAAKLHSFTRLLLRNCSKLRRLPSLKPLSGLQILDLSGTTSLVEMLEVCFEDKHELKTLNLSGTNLSELATTISELSSLNELLLRDCINLEAIPNIQELKNLEVIDVSGSTKLEKIEGSFEDMSYLREVNLSGTKVETPELPKDTKIHGLKRIFLADGTHFEDETWSKIKEKIERDRSENAISSDAVVTSQEISEEIRDIQSDEPGASDRTDMGDASKERLLQVPIKRALYKKTLLSLVDSESPQDVMEINETNKLEDDALANAEFVSFVDCTPTRLTSIFNKTKSVKRCWLRMCTDIKDLFSGVDEEQLKSLETLSITNLASLETISSVGKLENLKNLSLDCCPKIKTIFTEMPINLPVLNVKHCENLEKVVAGVEFSTLTLTWKADHCPKFEGNPKDSVSCNFLL